MHKTLLAVILLSLTACASGTPAEIEAQRAERNAADLFEGDPRRGEEVSKLCFAARIDGFTNSTDRAVVLREGNREYLVTTRTRCPDLDDAMSLAVDSFSSCLSRGDKLIGAESVFGGNFGGPPSIACFVDKIYEWDRNAETNESDAKEEETA